MFDKPTMLFAELLEYDYHFAYLHDIEFELTHDENFGDLTDQDRGRTISYDIKYTDVGNNTVYTSNNGWLYLGKDRETGNGLLVSAGCPLLLNYNTTGTNGIDYWWGTNEQAINKYGNSDTVSRVAYGLEENFDRITFSKGTDATISNQGIYKDIIINDTPLTGTISSGITNEFKLIRGAKIRMLTMDDLVYNGYMVVNGAKYEIAPGLSANQNNLIKLNNNIAKWLATPGRGSTTNLITLAKDNKVQNLGSGKAGVRLVIELPNNTPITANSIDGTDSSKENWKLIKNIADKIAQDDKINYRTKACSVLAADSRGVVSKYKLKIGDTFTIKYNNQDKLVKIIGFNHDILKVPQNINGKQVTKAGITFQFEEPIPTGTINKNATNTNGWGASESKNKLGKDTLKQFNVKETQDYMKEINKPCITGSYGNWTFTNASSTNVKIFLLSEAEVFGNTSFASYAEGEQYEYYANGGTVRKSDSWWLRTPNTGNSTDYALINTSGTITSTAANVTSGYALAFCF